ncbi:hypothetical protein LX64_04467 [Chitinophaga skermanii]|uniref:Cytokinin riboside 5'-monophosphate phosphoribohydrolase n=1 Tax=Chitinophaga skermanii TaxID=331697 RepID=A0A327Q7Q2_9BACT|nr:TIGR00730 family Rossman fold protein [Chitinophaga skermanii]RAI99913.1 hypothetical protein LX64_04467 [Chitinophaga skermanii]
MSTSIGVFCGSSVGNNPHYAKETKALGHLMADKGMTMVYGGGQAGLMGIAADAVLEKGGKVIGVIPEFLNTKERKHNNLTQQIEVQTMHQRKTILYELSTMAIALPGGFGTLDELFEIITWNQLTLHTKTVGLLNVDGFYDHLYQHILHVGNEGFAPKLQIENLHMAPTAEELLLKMA